MVTRTTCWFWIFPIMGNKKRRFSKKYYCVTHPDRCGILFNMCYFYIKRCSCFHLYFWCVNIYMTWKVICAIILVRVHLREIDHKLTRMRHLHPRKAPKIEDNIPDSTVDPALHNVYRWLITMHFHVYRRYHRLSMKPF